LTELVNTLWRQRESLDLLLFKVEEEQLLLACGRGRWRCHATREVEFVLERIRQAEVLRAIQSDDVAAALGLPPNSSLAALAEAAPEPWRGMLSEHRTAFLLLATEIDALALGTATPPMRAQRADPGTRYTRLTQLGQTATNRQVNLTAQPSDIEDIDLPETISDPQPRRTAHQAAPAATARFVQPSLADYLR
jgi:hypothetical protein